MADTTPIPRLYTTTQNSCPGSVRRLAYQTDCSNRLRNRKLSHSREPRQLKTLRSRVMSLLTALLFVWCQLAFNPSTLAAPLPAPSQQATDFSWSPSGGTITTSAGQVNVPFSATLTNHGGRDAFLISVNLPSGWSILIAPSSAVDIAQNSSQDIGFFISIPNNAAPGSYTLLITAVRSSTNATALLVLTVSVTPYNPCSTSQQTSGTTTALEKKPNTIIPQQVTDFYWIPLGGTLDARPGQINAQFLAELQNKGASDTFAIQINLPAGWTSLVTPSSAVFIPQDSSQDIGFFISIPKSANPGKYSIIITASRVSIPISSLAVLTVILPTDGCKIYLPSVYR